MLTSRLQEDLVPELFLPSELYSSLKVTYRGGGRPQNVLGTPKFVVPLTRREGRSAPRRGHLAASRRPALWNLRLARRYPCFPASPSAGPPSRSRHEACAGAWT